MDNNVSTSNATSKADIISRVKELIKNKDVKILAAALESSEDPAVRKEATWALGEIGDTRTIKPLINALNDRDWKVRREAAWALGKTGNRQ